MSRECRNSTGKGLGALEIHLGSVGNVGGEYYGSAWAWWKNVGTHVYHLREHLRWGEENLSILPYYRAI